RVDRPDDLQPGVPVKMVAFHVFRFVRAPAKDDDAVEQEDNDESKEERNQDEMTPEEGVNAVGLFTRRERQGINRLQQDVSDNAADYDQHCHNGKMSPVLHCSPFLRAWTWIRPDS